MLYYLFDYLREHYDFPGLRLFQYITFRTSLAIIISLIITTVFGHNIISYLRKMQVGETVRNLGLEGQMQKQGTPTMGGIMILLGILVPTLLLANLSNIYVILMIVTTVWMGAVGFLDDYIKVFRKNKTFADWVWHLLYLYWSCGVSDGSCRRLYASGFPARA